jgi:hypothetical protein
LLGRSERKKTRGWEVLENETHSNSGHNKLVGSRVWILSLVREECEGKSEMSFEGNSGGDGGGDNKQLGVLLAGYLEKQNPYGKVFRKRFVVLTQDAFHWFKVRTLYSILTHDPSPYLLS